MSNKILIYGGSGGIGSATAKRLKTLGFELHLAGRDAAKFAAVADEIGATHTAGDVLDAGFFTRVAEDADPALTGLVNAVGSISLRTLPRFSEDDLIKDFRLNAYRRMPMIGSERNYRLRFLSPTAPPVSPADRT